MTAPTISATLDAASYAPGDTMTLTVTYADSDSSAVTVTVVVTDASGQSAQTAASAQVVDPLTLQVSDPDRIWALVSDAGGVATFTATA